MYNFFSSSEYTYTYRYNVQAATLLGHCAWSGDGSTIRMFVQVLKTAEAAVCTFIYV